MRRARCSSSIRRTTWRPRRLRQNEGGFSGGWGNWPTSDKAERGCCIPMFLRNTLILRGNVRTVIAVVVGSSLISHPKNSIKSPVHRTGLFAFWRPYNHLVAGFRQSIFDEGLYSVRRAPLFSCLRRRLRGSQNRQRARTRCESSFLGVSLTTHPPNPRVTRPSRLRFSRAVPLSSQDSPRASNADPFSCLLALRVSRLFSFAATETGNLAD